jgi:hypothetical protein
MRVSVGVGAWGGKGGTDVCVGRRQQLGKWNARRGRWREGPVTRVLLRRQGWGGAGRRRARALSRNERTT